MIDKELKQTLRAVRDRKSKRMASFRLDDDLIVALEKAAADLGVTKTDLLTAVLKRAICDTRTTTSGK